MKDTGCEHHQYPHMDLRKALSFLFESLPLISAGWGAIPPWV